MVLVLVIALLLLVYAGIDAAFRGGALFRLPRLLLGALGLTLVLGLPFWPWEVLPLGDQLGGLAGGIAAFVVWNAATRDHDPVVPGPAGATRALLAMSALGTFLSPALLLLTAALLSGPFHFWQHHAAFPMRLLQLLVGYVVLAALMVLMPVPGEALAASLAPALIVVLTTMLASHYVITALAKGFLGPKPWSWVLKNRLHYLPAAAYSWGWARFVPWPRFRRGIEAVRRVERPLQLVVFSAELLVPLALLDQRLAVGACLVFAGLHLGVFALAGLFFWDWILADLLLALLFATLPREIAAAAFGPGPLLLGCAILLIFPLRHRLWKPMPLGWYDSPFTQRVHWQVTGKSGKTYGLYNDFMCPHERLYGKVHGCFAVPHAVVTYHLGELWKLELRDALLEAGPNLERLNGVRQRFGIRPRSPALTERHRQYLTAFFAALNAGAKKAALPRWARWLKAPGDQVFYWGDLPAYRRQEPVQSVRLVYREEFFDGRDIVRLRDEEILAFAIPHSVPATARELTPREMDDYLLGLAAGRLIDLPRTKRDYLAGDDQAAPSRIDRKPAQ